MFTLNSDKDQRKKFTFTFTQCQWTVIAYIFWSSELIKELRSSICMNRKLILLATSGYVSGTAVYMSVTRSDRLRNHRTFPLMLVCFRQVTPARVGSCVASPPPRRTGRTTCWCRGSSCRSTAAGWSIPNQSSTSLSRPATGKTTARCTPEGECQSQIYIEVYPRLCLGTSSEIYIAS